MSSDTPLPTLEEVTNFRELGGLPTADGRRVRPRTIFRSGHWGAASDADRAAMAELGVGIVFDFRSEVDIRVEGPDRLPEGTECVPLPTTDPSGHTDLRGLIAESGPEGLLEFFGEGGAAEFMRTGAARLVTDRTEAYAGFLARLAEPRHPAHGDVAPVLFHCSAGKDRAGWAASILLLALGVEESHVIEHYLLSNTHYDHRRQHGVPSNNPQLLEFLRPLVRVEVEYMEASLGAVRDHFGGVDAYLEEGLGLTPDQRSQLRANWLENA